MYDPLQYSILLPDGAYGWTLDKKCKSTRNVSCCDYYTFRLHV